MSLHRTSEGREISEFFFHCSLLQEPTNTCDCCVTEHLLCAFTLKTKDRYYKICVYLLTWITSTGSEQMQVCACPNETPSLIPRKHTLSLKSIRWCDDDERSSGRTRLHCWKRCVFLLPVSSCHQRRKSYSTTRKKNSSCHFVKGSDVFSALSFWRWEAEVSGSSEERVSKWNRRLRIRSFPHSEDVRDA